MKIQVFISSQLTELINYLKTDNFSIEIIENDLKTVQIFCEQTPTLNFVFSSVLTDEILNFNKETEGKTALISLNSEEIDTNLAYAVIEHGVEFIEMVSLKEFAKFIETISINIKESNHSEDLLMLQKQDEVFKPNQVWLKFLASIPGVSSIKAEAISRVYPDFTRLVLAYSSLAEDQRENMLKDIPTGSVFVGKSISKKIYAYINAEDPKLIL